MRASTPTAWLALVLLLAGVSAMADELAYRVAGLMDLGPDRKLAVIETTDGTQALYRVGDVLGDARIVDIGTRAMGVDLAGRRVTLVLSGRPVSLSAGGAPPPPLLEPPRPPRTATRTIRPAQAADAMRQDRRGESSVDRAERINGVLGLPVGTRILAVDRKPVASLGDAVEDMLPLLGAGEPVRLTVAGTEEMDEVYLLPEE